jgi:hypothetical protein
MPGELLFSLTLPIQYFGGTTPHKHSGTRHGREYSAVLSALYVPSRVTLEPEITWQSRAKECRDCHRLTHLQWRDGSYVFRLCQSCVKHRYPGRYIDALLHFLAQVEEAGGSPP